MINENDINFIRLSEKDYPLLLKWLNTDFVSKWYDKRSYTLEEIAAKYKRYISFEKPTYSFIIYIKEQPIGYIQTYRIDSYPDYQQEVDINENASGADLFIGEGDYIHKGLGKIILKKFLKDVAFDITNTDCCIIGPEPTNIVAIKTYEKVGFKYVKTIKKNTEDDPEYLMIIYETDL